MAVKNEPFFNSLATDICVYFSFRCKNIRDKMLIQLEAFFLSRSYLSFVVRPQIVLEILVGDL